jgi:hypothetical protein
MADGRRTLQVRGNLSIDRIKAAQVFGGEEIKFELRAMKPVKPGQLSSPCIICFICFVCIVCLVARAEEHGVRLREELSQ